MVLPAVGGFWLDRKWDTLPWCVILGAVVGFVAGMRQLLRMTGSVKRSMD